MLIRKGSRIRNVYRSVQQVYFKTCYVLRRNQDIRKQSNMIFKAERRQGIIYHFDLFYIKRLATLRKKKNVEQKFILLLEKCGHLLLLGIPTARSKRISCTLLPLSMPLVPLTQKQSQPVCLLLL